MINYGRWLINQSTPESDKSLIDKCIIGLTQYATALKHDNLPDAENKIASLRELIGELSGYWVLDKGLDCEMSKRYLEPFDDNVRRAEWQDNTRISNIASVVNGLYRYALEMIACQGTELEDEILACSHLIREIAEYGDFDSDIFDEICRDINNQVSQMKIGNEFEMQWTFSQWM